MVYFRYYCDLEENLTGLGVHLEVELRVLLTSSFWTLLGQMVSTATNSAGFLLGSVIDESTPTTNINIRWNVNGNPRKNNDPVTSVNLATLNDSILVIS